jgi:hypothetical protein
MSPAPSSTTRSPLLASWAIRAGRAAGLSSARARRWPNFLRPSTRASRSTPSIGCLAGRVDVGDDHGVGVVEARAELGHQVAQAGVAVRLDHGDDLAVRRHGAGGLQHGGDLDRVVAVVVDHADAVGDARGGEAALDPAEAGQAGADRLGVDAELARHGHGGGGVQHVVVAGHRHLQAVIADLSPSRGETTMSKVAPSGPIAMLRPGPRPAD